MPGVVRSTRRRREILSAYAFLLPSLIGISVFLAVPIVTVVWLSFQKWDLIGPAEFIGLDNFRAVLTDGRFLHSLIVTTLFVAAALPLQTVLGLGLGMFLERRVPGSAVFRVVLLLPWVAAPLALGIVWKWIFAPTDGLLNAIVGQRIEWLATPSLVLPAIVVVSVWTNIGYVSLFFAAGLRAIPSDVVDASRLDGAGRWHRFRYISLPLLRPTMFFVLVTGLISSFQVFDTAYALAPNGGPERAGDVVTGRIYYEAFQSFQFGRAAVMALVLFVILVVFTFLQQRYFRSRTTYEVA
ncbi:sugar ABC transporter permease [Rhodococcus sp. 06-156-3C]|uniref:carbohydrate ABC transporter permease n=1 Tax=Nocardiaceae TaxID=85025 RepID=UPI000522FE62|nr:MULTISPECIES: sugar ABC transporter permease [Rhodococcus]OZD15208.1 sugar ABC transporter permease [Rhodococcus sp. 06-156-4C]OZD19704.1 sugar ABC transporter permease [Rhodococcus sp. 06-156-4a]OZD22985.1 sugar ABC transporter permease [Rhodococcus sp. 06-156-3C]OZD25722.1 sugar ABC transporter permease [Rhodococcus sp. 06-156-3b]OZD37929.1 sugar ABC transporter permease [Rhodococcus sp. 06-156-3]